MKDGKEADTILTEEKRKMLDESVENEKAGKLTSSKKLRKEKQINLKKFEEILEREIRINFYPSFKEINKNLKENTLNGIILSGGIEL